MIGILRVPRRTPSRWTAAAVGLVVLSGLAAPPSDAAPRPRRPRIFEKGYRVKYFEECGTLGISKKIRLTDRYFVPPILGDIECSPGGPWGDYLYLVVTEGDAAADPWVDIERVSFGGKSEFYASVEPVTPSALNEKKFLTIAPTGWSGGEVLFATVIQSHRNGGIWGIALSAGWSPPRLPPGGDAHDPGPVAVDVTGDFTEALFYALAGEIVRVDPSGAEEVFASPPTIGSEMRFGPGGPWGTDLYTGGWVIAPDGTVTAFATPFGEFDWVQGAGFDGDMFELVPGSPPRIDRIRPDGTRTAFGTASAAHLASCNGGLWLAGADGCYVVTPRERRKNRSLLLR